jgi:MFS family permease
MKFRWSGNVLVLGLASMFTDVSSEMIIPLLPALLVSIGGGALALGAIEGASDAVAALLKLWSGRRADRAGSVRPLVLLGYGLSSLVRPLMAAALAPWHVMAVRVVDRVGKGIRTSPRDALLARSVASEERGSAFGFHRAMDHAGAAVGPLVAVALLHLGFGLRTIMWVAALPAALAMLVLAAGLRDEPRAAPTPPRSEGLERAERQALIRVLAPIGVFALANSSDAFVLLLAQELGAPLPLLPLVWTALHVVKSASSFAGGALADRFGAHRTLVGAWLVFAVGYTGFAVAKTALAVALLALLYGIFHGLSEAPERAYVASLAATRRRGTAFGWYNLTTGLVALPAGLLFGVLWQELGRAAAFGAGAGLALVAAGLLAGRGPGGAARPASQPVSSVD